MRSSTLLALAVAAVPLLGGARIGDPVRPAKPENALALVVNPRNPITNVGFDELRAYCRLERLFWPSKTRTELFLRPSDSPVGRILLERVYRMSHSELQKFWVAKVFRNEIPAKPAVVPNARAAGARVREIEGAFSFVLASEIPEGVRVVTIDGKKPGDEGYPLAGEPAP